MPKISPKMISNKVVYQEVPLNIQIMRNRSPYLTICLEKTQPIASRSEVQRQKNNEESKTRCLDQDLQFFTFPFKAMIIFQLRLQVQITISLELRYSLLTPAILKWGDWSKRGKIMTRDGDACLSSSSLKNCIAA